jgi:hypothetical protein
MCLTSPCQRMNLSKGWNRDIKKWQWSHMNSIAVFCVCSKTVKYIYMGTCFFTGKMIKLLRGLIKKHSKNCCLRWGLPGKWLTVLYLWLTGSYLRMELRSSCSGIRRMTGQRRFSVQFSTPKRVPIWFMLWHGLKRTRGFTDEE